MFALLLQSFPVSLVGHFVGMIERALDTPVLLNQLRRAFFADSLRAGNVVNRVAEQRHVVHHFSRGHSQNLLDLFFIHDNVALEAARTGAQRSHILSDELHHVLVVGHDQHFQIVLSGFYRHRADHIVRFVAFDFEHRQTHRLAQPADEGQLYAHFVRHRLPLRFVFFEQLVAESRSGRIKHNSDVIRLVVLDQPAQNISEEKRHVGGDAARTCEPLRHRRKEGAVNMRHGIHKKEFFRFSRHAGEYSKAPYGVREPSSGSFDLT